MLLLFISCQKEKDKILNPDEDKKVLNESNTISAFTVKDHGNLFPATIDQEKRLITAKIPPNVDLKKLDIKLIISDDAKTNLSEIKDFSSPRTLIVTSESGKSNKYTVQIEYMNKSFEKTCDKMNAWMWFGGDNRKSSVEEWKPFDRNVGAGQAVILEKDLYPTTFSVHLTKAFRYSEGDKKYDKPVTLKLIVRDWKRIYITETTTKVDTSFNNGFIDFDLKKTNLFLRKNRKYIFQWYLVNGESLGVTAGSSGNSDESARGFCSNGGYAGESRVSKGTEIKYFNVWGKHFWNFCFRLKGVE